MKMFAHTPDESVPVDAESALQDISVDKPVLAAAPLYTSRMDRLFAALSNRWRTALDGLERTPLAFKLSFVITLLVVSCMVLLGSLLIQQQYQQLQQQISEQGDTLARLMAMIEPLLD